MRDAHTWSFALTLFNGRMDEEYMHQEEVKASG